MDSKQVILALVAAAFVAVVTLGIIFHQDVNGYLGSLMGLFFGHHAISLASDDSSGGPDNTSTDQIPETPKVVPVSYTPTQSEDDKPKVRVKTTRYGKGIKAGGWDTYEDSGTDAEMGCFGNHLTNQACALTVSAQRALGAVKYDHILLTWDNGRTRTVRFEDRAPESDPRVDIYLPVADDPSIPSFGYAQVVTSDDLVTV